MSQQFFCGVCDYSFETKAKRPRCSRCDYLRWTKEKRQKRLQEIERRCACGSVLGFKKRKCPECIRLQTNTYAKLRRRENPKVKAYEREYYSRPDIAGRIAARRRLRKKVKNLEPVGFTRCGLESSDCFSWCGPFMDKIRLKKEIGWSGKQRKLDPEEKKRRRAVHDRLKCIKRRRAGGKAKASDIDWCWSVQEGRCYYCNNGLSDYHIDHFIPIAAGGRTDRENIRLACPKCNMAKSDKDPIKFMFSDPILAMRDDWGCWMFDGERTLPITFEQFEAPQATGYCGGLSNLPTADEA